MWNHFKGIPVNSNKINKSDLGGFGAVAKKERDLKVLANRRKAERRKLRKAILNANSWLNEKKFVVMMNSSLVKVWEDEGKMEIYKFYTVERRGSLAFVLSKT